MIVIVPSNGDGSVEETDFEVALFDAWWSSGVDDATFTLSSAGTAAGEVTSVSGPDGWTWLVDGTNTDFEVRCQPTSGSVGGGSAATNTWLSLGTTRLWKRPRTASDDTVTFTISIRLASSGTVLATCSITLEDAS